MSNTWHDEDWKRADDDPPRIAIKRPAGPTRAEEQERVDTEFSKGRMGLAEWRNRTNELSDLEKWDTNGKMK